MGLPRDFDDGRIRRAVRGVRSDAARATASAASLAAAGQKDREGLPLPADMLGDVAHGVFVLAQQHCVWSVVSACSAECALRVSRSAGAGQRTRREVRFSAGPRSALC